MFLGLVGSVYLIAMAESASDEVASAVTPAEGPIGDGSATPAPRRPCCRAATLRASILLAISVCAMSTGGIWFSLLSTTPPVMRVSWRLFLTAVFQAPGLVRDISRSSPELRARWVANLGLLALNGVFLAAHFAAWSWSIEHTTLVHSLLFVSTTPLLLVGWSTALWLAAMALRQWSAPDVRTADYGPAAAPPPWDTEAGRGAPPAAAAAAAAASAPDEADTARLVGSARDVAEGSPAPLPRASLVSRALAAFLAAGPHLPPTALEVAGTLVGFTGAALLAMDAGAEGDGADSGGGGYSSVATIPGDLVATTGAAAMGFCLAVGSGARQWAPLWVYAWTVTTSAAVAAALASFALEPAARAAGVCCGPASLLGWMVDGRLFGLVAGVALVSGIAGHTFANAALSVSRGRARRSAEAAEPPPQTAARPPPPQDISPLVVSVVMLLEPVAGGAIGWAVGVQVRCRGGGLPPRQAAGHLIS